MNWWPKSLRRRWERREDEADEAERRLELARLNHARARRLVAESRRLRQSNGFAESFGTALGIIGGTRHSPGHGQRG